MVVKPLGHRTESQFLEQKSLGWVEDLRGKRPLDGEQEPYREGLEQGESEKQSHKRSVSIFMCALKICKDP